MTKLLWVFFLAWMTVVEVFAGVWFINKDHSEIQFQVEYLKLAEVSGRFKNFSGKVDLSEQQVPEQIMIKVDTASVDTGNGLRDGHLKGNDFFQSRQHPFIFFKSRFIKPVGPGRYQAAGELTIKEMTSPMTIEFSLSESIKDTWNYQNKFVKFSSKINRTDFNLKWNKTLDEKKYLVGEVVSFKGIFQIQPDTAKTPSSKHMIPDTEYIRTRERVARGEILPKVEESEFVRTQDAKVELKAIESVAPGPEAAPDNYRDNTWWWVSLWAIGLLGFFAVIIVAFYSKNIFAEYFPRNYEENGIIGYLSDLVVISLVIIYSLAFWFLGWGIR